MILFSILHPNAPSDRVYHYLCHPLSAILRRRHQQLSAIQCLTTASCVKRSSVGASSLFGTSNHDRLDTICIMGMRPLCMRWSNHKQSARLVACQNAHRAHCLSGGVTFRGGGEAHLCACIRLCVAPSWSRPQLQQPASELCARMRVFGVRAHASNPLPCVHASPRLARSHAADNPIALVLAVRRRSRHDFAGGPSPSIC